MRKNYHAVALAGIVMGLTAPGYAQFTRALTGFETTEGFADADEVIWQQPGFSGTTRGILCTLDASNTFCTGSELDAFGNPWDLSQVVPWAQHSGDRSYEIYWVWTDPLDLTAGVRSTTFQADNLQRPSIHLGGKIRFKMAVTAFEYDATGNTFGAQITDGSASLLLCLGIRETGRDVAQGDTDTGGGDIEFVYLPGSEVIPTPDVNGMVAFPPGGKRYTATSEPWPPGVGEPEWVTVEFDLTNLAAVHGFANDGNGVDTAGDGVLDATLNPGGDGVNRGAIEALFFSNDANNVNGEVFFIYVDDVELVSFVPDPVSPPTINQPVFSGNPVTVTVNTRSDASSAELFRNNASLGSVTPVSGVAAFNNLNLSPGDLLEATQTANGITSDRSLPVVVFAPGTLLADNFDSYADQAALNVFWSNSINNPTPSSARLRLSTGSAASCENVLMENNSPSSNAARLYRGFGSANGTDADPLAFTYYFRQDINVGNARTRIEFARFTNGQWSVGARAEGTTGIGITNEVAGALQSEYGIMMRSTDPQLLNTNGTATPTDDVGTNGFFLSSGLLWAPTGVPRTPGVWHKMQVVVKSTAIDYYIDDALVNPVEWPGGVPRPNTGPYQFVILGQGFSNNGPAFFYDNISVTTSAAVPPFGPPNPVSAPAIVEPLFPSATTVQLEDVNSNALEVAVYRNGGATPIGTAAGPFLSNTASVAVAQLSDGDRVIAKQDVGGTDSCASLTVVVGVPAPSLPPVLVPGQQNVEVSNIEEGLASKVSVYRDLGAGNKELINEVLNPATDPVTVPVPDLVDGDTIVATQTVGGVESPDSVGVLVRGVPMCLIVFEDDFNLNTAANWTTLVSSADTSVTFAFDYSTIGVPAPADGDGTTRALRMAANMTSPGAVEAVTLAPIGQSFTTEYKLMLDMWINANGPFPAGGTGSTEFLTAGTGHDGATLNNFGAVTTGSGAWFAVSGEGGSSRDYRAYKNAGEQFAESGQWFAGTSSSGGGAHNNSSAYYAGFGGVNVAATVPNQTALHPNQTGTTAVGSAGFEWHKLVVTVVGTTATWEIDGLPIAQLDTTIGSTFPLDGNISVGYVDPFTSVSDNAAVSFGLADNVRVLVRHTPGSNADFDNDADVDLADHNYLVDCYSGPGASPSPSTGLVCANACEAAFDSDADGDVDLRSYAELQANSQ